MKNIKNIKRKIKNGFNYIILFTMILTILIPLWIMITGTFMGKQEIVQNIGSVLGYNTEYVSWTIMPEFPTLSSYVELLFDSPQFFAMFWNSCIQTFSIVFGQLLIGVPAAWAFARYRFLGHRFLFTLYIALMIMPFQVTMVSSYLVLKQFNLLDHPLAVILPGIFSTLPVFIMVKFFQCIPKELIESAQIDGASELQIFFKIGIPIGNSGIISCAILSFLEAWNAIEQPLTFLKDKTRWPLSLYLPQITTDKISVAFIGSVIMAMPALLIFLKGQTYLEQGIAASGIKQ